MESPTLVIIRGNSGSGKSVLAREVRSRSPRRTALVEQDYLRRTVLKEKENEGSDNVDLISQTVSFALGRGYDVVLEGILVSFRYGAMLRELAGKCPRTLAYYIDVPLEETLRRHATKPNAYEFGEREMREWYRERDLSGLPGERTLGADLSLVRSAETVLADLMG